MFAITLDENAYIKSFSNKFRTPGSILVDSIPDERDPEKLRCYQYVGKEYVFDAEKWAEIEATRTETARIEGVNAEISALKAQIAASDYQIIKCYEYALNDLEMPYDIEQLHIERQALRDRINALEETL